MNRVCRRKITTFIGLFILLTGFVASREEATTRSNFLHRKPSRNYRTKATQKPTRPTPASIADEDEVEEVRTSPQCPEPDGYFADSEQCDKYYACRYYDFLVFCFVFIFPFNNVRCCFNLLQ